MRALDPEVADAVWAAVEPLVPVPADTHPLGCHRPRVPDRLCFDAILIRLATGCSWEDAERLAPGTVSDTTLRARRDEWIAAGVFDHLVEDAVAAYDRIIELDLSEVAIDGSQHKAPCGGEGTGPNPTDRGRSGWKWSIAGDRADIPIGWATTGANRHDVISFEPTLDAVAERGLLGDIDTMHLDRGYDNGRIRSACEEAGITDLICAKKRPAGIADSKLAVPLGMRWPVERSNSWLTNFGQMLRNTDRRIEHRLAQLALAVTVIITSKLIDWRNRFERERKNYAGTSPITRASGSRHVALARFIRNRRLADAIDQWAFCSLNTRSGARAYYDHQRDKGLSHHKALRSLGNRLVGILHGCLRHDTRYDEHTAWAHRPENDLTTKDIPHAA